MTSTWSTADATAGGMTLSNANLTVNGTTAWKTIRGTNSQSSGKWYIEFLAGNASTSDQMWGLASAGFNPSSYLSTSLYSFGNNSGTNYISAGFTTNYTPAFLATAVGDVWALAVDFSAGSVWIAKNNVWLNSSNPGAGALPMISFVPATVGALFPALSLDVATQAWTLQPTPAAQKYLPPIGFQAWDGGPVTTSAWSAADATASGMTLSNGGMTVTSGLSAWNAIRGTLSRSSGKYYVEFLAGGSMPANTTQTGVANAGFPLGNGIYLGNANYSAGLVGTGGTFVSSGFTQNYTNAFGAYAAGYVLGLAVNFSAGSIWIAKNNIWVNSSNPATGTLPIISFTPATVGALFPAMAFEAGGLIWTLQPSPALQTYVSPAGFSAWDGGTKTPISVLAAALMVGV